MAIVALHGPSPNIVLAAGIIGYFGGRIAPEKFKAGAGHGASDQSFGSALIDDHTPVPDWARFTWHSTIAHVVVGRAISSLVVDALVLVYNW